MEVKRFIVGLCCLILASFSAMSYAENIPVNKNWEEKEGECSLSSCPTFDILGLL